MECLEPRCAMILLEWLKEQGLGSGSKAMEEPAPNPGRQGLLWKAALYQEDAPALRSAAELAGAIEHLEYAVFRRYQNQLTRAERARLDNTIDDALSWAPDKGRGREHAERLRRQAKRADLKLAQLSTLNAEGFEEFVAELFEALGYEVDRVGGTGDEGADLRVSKKELRAVVQCKYFSKGVIGSPDLQKFLGTIHHTRSHKGFFVTTRTFSLAAEKFVAEHPIELIDGPRLVELVQEVIGPGSKREEEPVWF